MFIRDFVETMCDYDNCEFSLFDCDTEKVIDIEDNSDLIFSDYAYIEIGGFDIWWDDKKRCIHVEFNVEIEEDE